MCWSRSWLYSALLITKVSSTNLSHMEGGLGKDCRALTSNSSMKMLAMMGADGGSHGCTLFLFVILTLEEEVGLS